MFNRKSDHESQLEVEIHRVQSYLSGKDIDSKEYADALKHLSELHKLQEKEKPAQVSPDTLLVVGANLLGIFMIIKHEHVNVITSRAMSMLIKPR